MTASSPPKPTPWNDESRLIEPPSTDRESFGLAFERLVGVMARLRAPGGCPWDREQTLASLKPYLIEEAYEVLEAIDQGGAAEHREELGDLLLQVVFQAELRREEGTFDAADVAHGIADKLVRRHPHVFEQEGVKEASEALRHWEARKAEEKKGRSVLGGVPRNLPSLLRAQRVGEKASQVGFDWPGLEGPLEKIDEELRELKAAIAAGDQSAIEAELGDLLFSVVNVARFLQVGAEDALRSTTDRFVNRFQHIERELARTGQRFSETSLETLEALWEDAKRSSST
jgi:MazG family protein